ncbi:MAG: hypothetical protein AB7E55_11505, partial [Pigmentiphaga sp.]
LSVLSGADASRPVTVTALEDEHAQLSRRLALAPPDAPADPEAEAAALWRELGVPDARHVPDLDVAALLNRFVPQGNRA